MEAGGGNAQQDVRAPDAGPRDRPPAFRKEPNGRSPHIDALYELRDDGRLSSEQRAPRFPEPAVDAPANLLEDVGVSPAARDDVNEARGTRTDRG